MAITYGFFNSLNGDRVYNADDMSTYFKGLIGNGVYENIGGALQVLASTTPDMYVNVQTGRAVVDCKWIENDAILPIELNAAHVTLNRYTAIVIRLDIVNRTISIVAKDGENATDPVKPALTNNASIKEKCLAYVYVAAAASAISQSAIQDNRANTSECGWITGLIDQVDTSTLFNQWSTAYAESVADMEDWQTERESDFETWETEQITDLTDWQTNRKNAFDSWFATLTQELTVGAYVAKFEKTVTLTSGSSTTIALDMTNYSYESTDIFDVDINGLAGVLGTDYTLNTSTPSITVNITSPVSEVIHIRVMKSVLGTSQLNS